MSYIPRFLISGKKKEPLPYSNMLETADYPDPEYRKNWTAKELSFRDNPLAQKTGAELKSDPFGDNLECRIIGRWPEKDKGVKKAYVATVRYTSSDLKSKIKKMPTKPVIVYSTDGYLPKGKIITVPKSVSHFSGGNYADVPGKLDEAKYKESLEKLKAETGLTDISRGGFEGDDWKAARNRHEPPRGIPAGLIFLTIQERDQWTEANKANPKLKKGLKCRVGVPGDFEHYQYDGSKWQEFTPPPRTKKTADTEALQPWSYADGELSVDKQVSVGPKVGDIDYESQISTGPDKLEYDDPIDFTFERVTPHKISKPGYIEVKGTAYDSDTGEETGVIADIPIFVVNGEAEDGEKWQPGGTYTISEDWIRAWLNGLPESKPEPWHGLYGDGMKPRESFNEASEVLQPETYEFVKELPSPEGFYVGLLLKDSEGNERIGDRVPIADVPENLKPGDPIDLDRSLVRMPTPELKRKYNITLSEDDQSYLNRDNDKLRKMRDALIDKDPDFNKRLQDPVATMYAREGGGRGFGRMPEAANDNWKPDEVDRTQLKSPGKFEPKKAQSEHSIADIDFSDLLGEPVHQESVSKPIQAKPASQKPPVKPKPSKPSDSDMDLTELTDLFSSVSWPHLPESESTVLLAEAEC